MVVGFSGFKLHDNSAIDTAIDFFQDFVTSPESYFDSIGVREKQAVEPEENPGFKIFAIPFVGVEIGVKEDISSGREAFIEVENVQRFVAEPVDLRKVTVHVLFDGTDFMTNGLFHAFLEYKMEVDNGDGDYKTEEGSVKVVRRLLEDGTWETFVKTENPWALNHRSAKAISNLQFELLTADWLKMIQGHYINPSLGQDLRVKFVQSKYNISSADKEIAFAVEVEDKEETYTGEVAAKLTPGRHQKVLVNINKGSTKLLELQLMFEQDDWTDFDVQGNLILSGVEHGRASASFKDNSLALTVGSYQMRADIHPGESATIVVEKEGKVLWSFNSLLKCKSKDGLFHKVLTANVSQLDPARSKEISLNAVIVVDSSKKHLFRLGTNKIYLVPFKVEFEIFEEKRKFVHFIADTTTGASPYRLSFWSPDLLRQEDLTLTVDHEKGLTFDVNIFGGLHLDLYALLDHGERTVSIKASQAGVEMFRFQGETKEVNNNDTLLIGFESSFDLIQDVDRFKRAVAFKRVRAVVNRKVKLEFFWDKKKKNGILNMFHILGQVEKDGNPVFDLLISTDEGKPYKLHLLSSPISHFDECLTWTPLLFPCDPPGTGIHAYKSMQMFKIDMEVEHTAGKSLELKVEHPRGFKGFKVTRDADKAEVEWDGRKLGEGEFSLTERRFQVNNSEPSWQF